MKTEKPLWDIFIRYGILILVAIPNLWLFYSVFTPLTVYPVYWLLNVFFDVSLLAGNVILVNNTIPIELIQACIAGSAYYLLLMLNLFTPKIKMSTRLRMILYSFLAFLVINILRIFILSIVAVNSSSFFNITHKIFWYSVSTVFVVGIWFAQVKTYKVKEIPLYSDIKYISRLTRK